MIRSYLIFLILYLVSTSCSSEKVSLSPLYDAIIGNRSDVRAMPTDIKTKNKAVFYASQLTTQISTIPNFKSDVVNKEITSLKSSIRNYVYAVQDYNLIARRRSLRKVENSYKKIQELRKYLSPDEDDTINRYLVRIKSNISQLESLQKTEN